MGKVPFVIDIGSGSFKGYFGEGENPCEIPSIVGTKCHKFIEAFRCNQKEYYIDSYSYLRGCLNLHYPVKHGVVLNWDYFNELIHYLYYSGCRAAPEEYSLLITEPIFNPKEQREKMSEIMFEEHQVPMICFQNQSELTLIANNKRNGIVVESGDGITQIVPIYDLNRIRSAMKRIDIGGREITNYLFEELNKQGSEFHESNEMELIREIKEKISYVSSDYQNEIHQNNKTEYELPDGEKIQIGNERINSAEIMFKPSLIQSEENGIHQLINQTILKCDSDIQNEMYNNIVLSGGNTLIDGFEKRIEFELKEMEIKSFNLISPQNRKYSTWIGGSILSNLSSFYQMGVTKDDYDENGIHSFSLKFD